MIVDMFFLCRDLLMFDTLLLYWMTSQNVVRRVSVGHVLRADQKWLHHQVQAKLTVSVQVIFSTCQSLNKIVFMKSKDYGFWSAVTYYEMSAAAVTSRISSKQFPAVLEVLCLLCVQEYYGKGEKRKYPENCGEYIFSSPRLLFPLSPLLLCPTLRLRDEYLDQNWRI